MESRLRDTRDFGVSPTATPLQNRIGIQAAIDSIPKTSTPVAGSVHLGEGVFTIDQPIFLDNSNVRLYGEGRDSTIIKYGPWDSGSVVYVGMRRLPLSADHYVDAYQKLDATIAPTINKRWALCSKGTDVVVFAGNSPFQQGPLLGWQSVSKMTLELAFDGPLAEGFSIGASYKARPRPFLLFSRKTDFIVSFGIDVGLMGTETKVTAIYQPLINLAPGRHSLVIQADFDDPLSIRLWLDGTRLAHRGSLATIAPGSTFARNRQTPFKIGIANDTGTSIRSDYYDGGTLIPDWTLLGFRQSAELIYKTDDVLKRIDNAPITDARTYFAANPNTVGYFPMTNDPSCAATRKITAAGPLFQANNFGLWIDKDHGNPYGVTSNNSIDDLSLWGARSGVPFGSGMTLGSTLNFRSKDVGYYGGAHGVGCWNWGLAYVSTFWHCIMSGSDAHFYSFNNMIRLYEIEFGYIGRSGVVNHLGALWGRDWFFPGGTKNMTETVVENWRGGVMGINQISVDIETADIPTVTAFLAETASDHISVMNFQSINLGSFKKTQPIFTLLDRNIRPRMGIFKFSVLEGLAGSYPALVQCEGGWKGTIDGTGYLPFPLVTGAGSADFINLDTKVSPPL